MHVLLLIQKPVKRELTSGRAECGIVYDVSLLDTLKLLLQNDTIRNEVSLRVCT